MRSEEQRAVGLLLGVTLLVPATWLALGWRWDLLVGGNDLSLLLLPAMRRLLAVHGDFDAFLYDPSWLGGSKLRDLLGALPLHRLLGALPISPISLLNLSVFFAQTLYAYLAAVAARAFCTLLSDPSASDRTTGAHDISWSAQLCIALLAAFAPVLGWRIGYGHLYILFGALALPAACALLLLAQARQLTVSSCAVAVLTLLHVFPHVGQQPVLYGAVFGLPLVLGLVLCRRAPTRELRSDLTPLALALLGALLCSLPVLTGLYSHFAGADAPRGFRSEAFTYSYLVATGHDWLGSLAWSLSAACSRRPAFALHESNYPLGPVLLCALLCPRKSVGVLWCAAASGAAVLVFSMDLLPLSRWLLAALPPLSLFRIPARAALPLLLALLPLLLALLVLRLPARSARRDALLLVPALLLVVAQGAWSELLLWLVVLVCVLLARRAPGQRAWLPSATALLALLALGSVLGFRERLLPFASAHSLLHQPQAAGAWARGSLPELSSPLKRTVSPPDLRANNLLYAMGLSGVSGYNLLNERFLRLYCALLGVPYQARISLVSIDARAPYFPALAALYDVVAKLEPGAPGSTLERLPGQSAPLWFSERLAARGSYEELVHQLLPANLRSAAAFVVNDPSAQHLPAVDCQVGRDNIRYQTGTGPTLLQAELSSPRSGLCPLTISMNFVEDFVVLGLSGQTWRPLRTFPAYGALLGIIVPSEVSRIKVVLEPYQPGYTLVALALGATLLGLLLVYVLHSNGRARAAKSPAPRAPATAG